MITHQRAKILANHYHNNVWNISIFLFDVLPGHSWILQLSVCLADPEHGDPNRKSIGDPPFWAVVLICLDFSLTPAPHVFEHGVQSLQEVQSQSTVTISRKGPHYIFLS